MPTYQYRCRKCGHEFELFHSIKDDKPKKCPRCGARAARIPAGGAGLLFKGSGFYITDYRSDSYREKAKSDRGAGSGAAGDKAAGDKAAGDKAAGDKAAPDAGGRPAAGKAGAGPHPKPSAKDRPPKKKPSGD